MRQFNVFRGTKGWLSMWERTIRFRSMRNEQEVRRRAKALDVWREHGIGAVMSAFDVSRPTLYRWKKTLKEKQGHLDALDPKSRAPKSTRERQYPEGLLEQIIKLREEHRRIGKKKIAVLLNIGESYAGRCLTDLKRRKLLPQYAKLSFSARTGRTFERSTTYRKKIRRPKGHKRGMELDTIVRFIDGTKRYILTAIDVERRFAFASAYTSHSSTSAADFLTKLITVCPFSIDELQTDNGSEFAHHFGTACTSLGITHFHTYPRTPKMNAHIERFNRTLSEDFISLNRPLLRDNLHAFNLKLVDWLIWYNTVRPHESLGMVSPLRYIVSTLTARESHMCWTRTVP